MGGLPVYLTKYLRGHLYGQGDSRKNFLSFGIFNAMQFALALSLPVTAKRSVTGRSLRGAQYAA